MPKTGFIYCHNLEMENIKENNMELRKFVADEGKVWKHKPTGVILSNELYLGINDSIDNYEQVEVEQNDEPVENV